jgi:hypothetical protein
VPKRGGGVSRRISKSKAKILERPRIWRAFGTVGILERF